MGLLWKNGYNKSILKAQIQMKKKSTTRKFNTAKEMDASLEKADLSKDFEARGVVHKPPVRKINLDLPESVIDQIDSVASRIGIARQPLIKLWIHEKLKSEK